MKGTAATKMQPPRTMSVSRNQIRKVSCCSQTPSQEMKISMGHCFGHYSQIDCAPVGGRTLNSSGYPGSWGRLTVR